MKPKVLPITQLGAPVLRRRLKDVVRPSAPKTQALIDDMMATMRKAQGVGIAANQVGVDQRLFIIAPEPSARYPKAPRMAPVAMINPDLVRASKRMVTDWEGCLSIPGLRARVPRHHEIEIAFTTREGDRVRAVLRGFVARIFQHEFDHISGKVFVDRVVDTRTFMTEAEYRKMMLHA
jgi:peptide deformylase